MIRRESAEGHHLAHSYSAQWVNGNIGARVSSRLIRRGRVNGGGGREVLTSFIRTVVCAQTSKNCFQVERKKKNGERGKRVESPVGLFVLDRRLRKWGFHHRAIPTVKELSRVGERRKKG